MSTWAELYGEENEGRVRIPRSDEIWCDNCNCYVSRYDLKSWSGDDMRHYLCPGCDANLLEPDILE